MNNRGLTELGALLFLDRYALKDATRQTLQVGSTVLTKIDNKTEIAVVEAIQDGKVFINLQNEAYAVDVELIDVPIELDPADMWKRVAQNIAEQETTSEKFEEWFDKFYWLLEDWKFVPGGRILAAAGTDSELTYYNCYVIPSPKDSKDEIFKTCNTMAQIMSRGGGVGINISSLRPKYAYTTKTHGRSSGAVSWGELYSYTTGLIEQMGSRRGALMLILDDWHPDLMEFVNVKRDMKRIKNANISVGISDEFMHAVETDDDWHLMFPDTTDPEYDELWDGDLVKWVTAGKQVKIWKTLKARDIWDAIIESAWACAEPGVWFKGRVNKFSNSYYYSQLIACNPCSEQPLGEWNTCLLGSINLSKFVTPAVSTNHWVVDWNQLKHAVHCAVRFMDNVIDATPYIYSEMETAQKGERRIGMGTMGLAEMLVRLKLRYGSPESLKFIDELYQFITCHAYDASVELAIEKGRFPNCDPAKFLNSGFMQTMPDNIRNKIAEHGVRNVTLITQAPTGTTGTLVNTSTGIEPFYFWEYERKGRFGSHIEKVKVYEEWLEQAKMHLDDDEPLPNWFVTAQDLTPEEHIKVQAAIQLWVDSSISKTCNVPNDYTVEQVKELYELMYELGCKGGTIYRDGSRSEQVLNLPSAAASDSNVMVESTYSENKTLAGGARTLKTGTATRSRPAALVGKTYRKNTALGTAYITVNRNGTDEAFETFVNVGKAGSDVACDAEALGRLISFILRMPSFMSVQERIENVVAQLGGIGSSKQQGFGKQRVMSLPDAIAQVLAEHADLAGELPKMPEYEVKVHSNADICPGCGNASLVRIEGCQKCVDCGYAAC